MARPSRPKRPKKGRSPLRAKGVKKPKIRTTVRGSM